MRKILLFLSIILSFPVSYAQNWTQPLNVSNMEWSAFPGIAVDENGILHVVWSEKIESNFRKIMYSKSVDDGNTWSTPFDLSQNSDTACTQAHIVAGNDNKLYVTYDYNVGNPYQTYVHMKIFDGNVWGSTIVVSENLPASHQNVLVADNDDRIYVFWYRGHKFCYRYLENNIWSDVSYPYENQHGIEYAVADSENNLHCVGHYTYNGADVPGIRITYFKYIKSTDEWNDIILVNEEDTNVGADIALDSNEIPHFVWNQHITNSSPWIDGTIYCYQIEPYLFSEEELVEHHTYMEKIHISDNNVINIFLSTVYEDIWAFKHYFKLNGNWYNTTIDNIISDLITGCPNVAEQNGKLYVSYFRCTGPGDCDVMFSKSDLITDINQNQKIKKDQKLNVFPNPFSDMVTIRVHISETEQVSIKIYDIMGKSINTVCNSILKPGDHSFIWFGTNVNGTKVNQGNYIITLEQNKITENKMVHFMNGN